MHTIKIKKGKQRYDYRVNDRMSVWDIIRVREDGNKPCWKVISRLMDSVDHPCFKTLAEAKQYIKSQTDKIYK